MRELEEELGLKAKPQDLQEAFLHYGHAEAEFYGKPFKNSEISMVYLYSQPVDISELRLQKEEVEEVCWMEYGKVLAEVQKEAAQGRVGNYCIFLDELEQIGEHCLALLK